MCHGRNLSYSFFMKVHSVTLNLLPQNSHQFVFSAIICDRDEQGLKMRRVFKGLHNYDSQLRLCTKIRQFLWPMKAASLWFWETASKNSEEGLLKKLLKKASQKGLLKSLAFSLKKPSWKAVLKDHKKLLEAVSFQDFSRQLFEAAFYDFQGSILKRHFESAITAIFLIIFMIHVVFMIITLSTHWVNLVSNLHTLF